MPLLAADPAALPAAPLPARGAVPPAPALLAGAPPLPAATTPDAPPCPAVIELPAAPLPAAAAALLPELPPLPAAARTCVLLVPAPPLPARAGPPAAARPASVLSGTAAQPLALGDRPSAQVQPLACPAAQIVVAPVCASSGALELHAVNPTNTTPNSLVRSTVHPLSLRLINIPESTSVPMAHAARALPIVYV